MFDNFISPQPETFPLRGVKKINYPKLSSGDTLRFTQGQKCTIPAILIEESSESRPVPRSSDILEAQMYSCQKINS